MKIARLFAIFILLMLAACAVPGTNAVPPTFLTLGPSQTPTDTASTAQKVVEVSLIETSSYGANAEIAAGGTAHLRLSLEPVVLTISPGMVSTKAWEGAGLKDMQVCFALDQVCSLDGMAWTPFQAETVMDYPVDWLGSRKVWAMVQVRDAAGASVPTFLRYGSSATAQAQVSFEVVGQIDASIPAENQPAFVQTAIAATQTAFPVTGSVVIEGGRCCVGGTPGSTVNVQVEFAAQSTAGKVTEMRVSHSGGCQKDAATLDAPWEPFVPSKTYSAGLAINWVGWYISVQYRDDQGSLSPVYCDDISLEGSPPQPTP